MRQKVFLNEILLILITVATQWLIADLIDDLEIALSVTHSVNESK